MHIIRVDNEVWRELQTRAVGFTDTPSSTIRRVLGIRTAGDPNEPVKFSLASLIVSAFETGDDATVREIYAKLKSLGWVTTPICKIHGGRKPKAAPKRRKRK